jgi:hypothetical protein
MNQSAYLKRIATAHSAKSATTSLDAYGQVDRMAVALIVLVVVLCMTPLGHLLRLRNAHGVTLGTREISVEAFLILLVLAVPPVVLLFARSPRVEFGTLPVGELLPGGQNSARWREWLAAENIEPRVTVRMPSFTHLARMTRETGVASVLPEIASVDFDEKKIVGKTMPWKHDRQIVLIANARCMDRSGIRPGAAVDLARRLKFGEAGMRKSAEG